MLRIRIISDAVLAPERKIYAAIYLGFRIPDLFDYDLD
jgi:hypothetical protein